MEKKPMEFKIYRFFTIVEGEFQGIPASWGAKARLKCYFGIRKNLGYQNLNVSTAKQNTQLAKKVTVKYKFFDIFEKQYKIWVHIVKYLHIYDS